MDFTSAIKSCFGKYATFSGRACRSEYWYFYLFYVIIIMATQFVDSVVIGSNINFLTLIWSIAVFLPQIAVAVRRLHDIDRTGWWILLGLIPLIGAIILIVWTCKRGTAGSNRFGADPLA